MLCRSLGVLAFLTALQCSNASADDVIHVVGPGLVLQAPLTADAMWARIREAASKYAEFAPVPRAAFFDITYPANRTEYDDLAGFGVLLVTVVTQDAAELPVPRVYLEGARVRHDFRLLSSVKSPVPEPSVVRVLGPHRF